MRTVSQQRSYFLIFSATVMGFLIILVVGFAIHDFVL